SQDFLHLGSEAAQLFRVPRVSFQRCLVSLQPLNRPLMLLAGLAGPAQLLMGHGQEKPFDNVPVLAQLLSPVEGSDGSLPVAGGQGPAAVVLRVVPPLGRARGGFAARLAPPRGSAPFRAPPFPGGRGGAFGARGGGGGALEEALLPRRALLNRAERVVAGAPP